MALLSLHSPSTKQNRNDNENVKSCAMYESKEMCHRSDNVEGLWINRFFFAFHNHFVLLFFFFLHFPFSSEVSHATVAAVPHVAASRRSALHH